MNGVLDTAEISRERFLALIHGEMERLRSQGGKDEELKIYTGLLKFFARESDPTFYDELYMRYARHELISLRHAALGALYARSVCTTKNPIEAEKEAVEFSLEVDEEGMVKLPAWILIQLVYGVRAFLSGQRDTLHDAFGKLPTRTKGAAKLDQPIRDLNTVAYLLVLKERQIRTGRRPSTDAAVSDIEQFAMNLETTDDKTKGFSKRSVHEALSRIRLAFSD